jgi:hypothetical protein
MKQIFRLGLRQHVADGKFLLPFECFAPNPMVFWPMRLAMFPLFRNAPPQMKRIFVVSSCINPAAGACVAFGRNICDGSFKDFKKRLLNAFA